MRKPRSDIPSQNVTARSRRGETGWDGHASMPRVWNGKPPGGAGTEWPCGHTIPPQRPSRPPIGRGSGRPPRIGRPRVCDDPAGASDASAGGPVLGAVRADRRVQPGPGQAAPGPGGPPSRAPGRHERPLLRGGRSARAPASAGAPAPGARQGHQGSRGGIPRTPARTVLRRLRLCPHPRPRWGDCAGDMTCTTGGRRQPLHKRSQVRTCVALATFTMQGAMMAHRV